jgi:hypothetical protein
MKEGLRSQIPGQVFSNLQNLLGAQTQAFLPKPQKQLPFWKQLLLSGAERGASAGANYLGSKLF